MLIVKISILVNCINGGVKITKRMTILVLLLIFAILSISSVSANDVDNNLAIDENEDYTSAYKGRNQAMLENHVKILDLQESLKKYF